MTIQIRLARIHPGLPVITRSDVSKTIHFYFEEKTHTGLGLSNRVGGAHRYDPDYDAFKGRELNPARFELTLREAPMWRENAELKPRG